LNNPATDFTSEPDRFGRALLLAAVITSGAITAFALTPPPPPPVPPSTVQLQIVAVAPAPVAPPKPIPTPPAPPHPIAPPQPVPPPPPKADHPQQRMHPRPVVTPPPQPQATPPLPEPPAPQVAAPPLSPDAQASILSRYVGAVRAVVLSNLVVPQLLVDDGMEGDCVLEFTLAPDGTLLSASVETPSGLVAVNQAAMDALRASRLPAFLAGMPDGPHSFTLPVHVSGDTP